MNFRPENCSGADWKTFGCLLVPYVSWWLRQSSASSLRRTPCSINVIATGHVSRRRDERDHYRQSRAHHHVRRLRIPRNDRRHWRRRRSVDNDWIYSWSRKRWFFANVWRENVVFDFVSHNPYVTFLAINFEQLKMCALWTRNRACCVSKAGAFSRHEIVAARVLRLYNL